MPEADALGAVLARFLALSSYLQARISFGSRLQVVDGCGT